MIVEDASPGAEVDIYTVSGSHIRSIKVQPETSYIVGVGFNWVQTGNHGELQLTFGSVVDGSLVLSRSTVGLACDEYDWAYKRLFFGGSPKSEGGTLSSDYLTPFSSHVAEEDHSQSETEAVPPPSIEAPSPNDTPLSLLSPAALESSATANNEGPGNLVHELRDGSDMV